MTTLLYVEGGMSPTSYQALEAVLASERRALLDHPVYAEVATPAKLRTLMGAHVFAVWDFMSLLKSLQRRLTCVEVPWRPSRSPRAARLVNAIVLGEESDEIDGRAISHFELYLQAMREVGADTASMERHLTALENGASVTAALEIASVPEHVRQFVACTFDLAHDAHVEATAGAFLVGREDLVPEMFARLLPTVQRERSAPSLVRYLARHVEVDAGEHGPAARRLLEELCGDDGERWQRAVASARRALIARRLLWDGVMRQLVGSAQSVTLRA